jgi:parallel beta-helix repeat protein
MRGSGISRRLVPLLCILSLLILIPSPPFSAKSSPNTLLVPSQYVTIQQAVNAASPGDTIIVSPSPSGTYAGNVTINKSLTLTGVGTSSVIVNASNVGPGIVVNGTSSVSISGMTIEDPDSLSNGISVLSSLNVVVAGVVIRSTVPNTGSNGTFVFNSNGVVLRNNTITGNLYGVAVEGGFSNTLRANNITRNGVDVFLGSTTGNQVKNNVLRKGQSGLDVWDNSTGNFVSGNVIANNTNAGIWVRGSSGNRFVGNDIDFNNITSSFGVKIERSAGNRFYYNNIRHNSIQIFAVSSGDVSGNTWDDGGSSPRGNYWSYYPGVDNGTGGRPAGDGVGDTFLPWPCRNGGRPCSVSGPAGVDDYPLMNPVNPPAVNVTLTALPLSGCPVPNPLLVAFSGSFQGGLSPYQFSWQFGDGTVAGNLTSVSHMFTGRGSFFVTLTVYSSTPANSGSDSVTITAFPGALVLHLVDSANNSIAGANVTSISQPPGLLRLSGIAAANGTVSFPCLPPGPYSFRVSSPGFQSVQSTILIANSTVVRTLILVKVPNVFPLALLEYVGIGAALAVILVAGTYAWSRSKRGKIRTTA